MPAKPINGHTLHYLERGRGPVLVLLHGFPIDSRMWQGQVDALSDQCHVIAPDFRGFGKSASTERFTIESLADDVHALITAITDQPVTLAGLSMGGYVALAYARHHASTLNGLILIDTKADADSPDAKESRAKMITQVREKGAVSIADAMQPKLLAPNTVKNKPAIVKRLREMTDHCPPLTIEHALAAMRDRPDQTALLPTLTIPTLILVGDTDSITPPIVAQAMHHAVNGSQFSIIRGAGHMSPMEQPEQVNAAIQRFMSRS